ncbi:MAG: hypothetical protein JWN27_4209 [Candidatus Eremiobacteraeota bacterium]|nr:hypothetical protein [Candidatus Eremiobacteraeota bacterium]
MVHYAGGMEHSIGDGASIAGIALSAIPVRDPAAQSGSDETMGTQLWFIAFGDDPEGRAFVELSLRACRASLVSPCANGDAES